VANCYYSFTFNQLRYLTDKNGEMLVDFIGRFENFTQDLSHVFDMLGVDAAQRQRLEDLLAGRVHLFVSPTLSVMPSYRAGKLRILAVTSPERLAAAPEIPTLKEKGLSFVRFGWLGVCAGAGTPQPIIAVLNRHIVAAVKARAVTSHASGFMVPTVGRSRISMPRSKPAARPEACRA
jgi:hypothetical protein